MRALGPLAQLIVLLAIGLACDDDESGTDEPQEEPVLEVQANTSEPVCMLVTEDFPAEVETLPVIGCDVPHTHEIYATVEYDERTVFPGVEELGNFAQVGCLEAFEPFVGTSPFDSSLSYTWLVPTLSSWNDDDDRDVLCVLAARDGAELVGTMRQSNA